MPSTATHRSEGLKTFTPNAKRTQDLLRSNENASAGQLQHASDLSTSGCFSFFSTVLSPTWAQFWPKTGIHHVARTSGPINSFRCAALTHITLFQESPKLERFTGSVDK